MDFKRNHVQMLINGFMSTAIVYAACELDLFDAINKRAIKIQSLADELDVEVSYLLKLIRPLEQYKLLTRDGEKISITEMGELLTTDKEDSLKDYALFCGRECIKVWMEMYSSMKERKTPMEIVGQQGFFDDMENDENRFSTFNKMMSSVSKQLDLEELFKVLADKYSTINIVDVGGGTGTIIKKFLGYYTQAKGTIVDLDQAEEAAQISIDESPFAKRCTFRVGNFFEPLNIQGDIFILSRVLHDWDDECSENILKNVVDAMSDESKLVVIDEIISETDNPNALKGYICDIQMWVFCNGQERTRKEFDTLFEKVGLEISQCINIDNGTSAIICKKKNKTVYEMGEI